MSLDPLTLRKYQLEPLDHSTASRDLNHAEQFVEHIENTLRQMGAIQ